MRIGHGARPALERRSRRHLRSRFAPVPPATTAIRPWWEWVAFGLGVIGSLKIIWAWTVVPFLQRPKLSGSLEKLVVRGRGVTASPQDAADSDTAFDPEICMYVYAYNKRQQPTSLKKWVLRVRAQGRQRQELNTTPNQDLAKRRAPYVDPSFFMPETIQFEWRSPARGWLYFRCPNIRQRALGSARYKLFVVDIDDRRHHLASGYLPATPGRPPNGVLAALAGAGAAEPPVGGRGG